MRNNRPNLSPLHHVFIAAKGSLERMISRLVPPKEIEDIVQEAYVRICQLDQHEVIAQPKSFLMKTARTLAIDYLKKSETRFSESVEQEWEYSTVAQQDEDATFEQAATEQEFAHFCKAIRELPVQCRRVFVLKKVYGYTQKEIAKELDISESTVEKHIAVGFKRCTIYMLKVAQNDSSTTTNESGDHMEEQL
jgi:RNA polymerase sigma factor (sigma-70 family)